MKSSKASSGKASPQGIGALKRFEMIIGTDSEWGISKDGRIPWDSDEAVKYFKELTTSGDARNVVIMGRGTFENIHGRHPLSGGKRSVFVISRSWKQDEHPEAEVCSSIKIALARANSPNYGKVFIGGGVEIFKEVFSKWMYLCDAVHITRFKTNCKCDASIDPEWVRHYPLLKEKKTNVSELRVWNTRSAVHEETGVLELLESLISEDGGPFSTKHLRPAVMNFDCSKQFPLFTTNAVAFKDLIKVVILAINGGSDANILHNQGVMDYDSLTSSEVQKSLGSGYFEGDMGAWWGYQMRFWGHPYESVKSPSAIQNRGISSALKKVPTRSLVDDSDDSTDEIPPKTEETPKIPERFVDQLGSLVNLFRSNQTLRGSIFLKDPLVKEVFEGRYSQMDFHMAQDRSRLDLVATIISSDALLQLKDDVAIFAFLLNVVAILVGVLPGSLSIVINDLWTNSVSSIRKQIDRTPIPFPELMVRDRGRITEIRDFTSDKFVIQDYETWERILPPMEKIKIKKKK
jgi:dihydrofolate reductase/thymidylate synthase